MAQTRTRSAPAAMPHNPWTDRTVVSVVTAVVILVLLAGYTGWILHGLGRGKHPVSVDKTFTGVISVISATKDAGCVVPEGGGKQVCSNFAVVPGTTVGQGVKVRAAHEWYENSGGSRTDILVLYPAGG